jgi:hypothetical protein
MNELLDFVEEFFKQHKEAVMKAVKSTDAGKALADEIKVMQQRNQYEEAGEMLSILVKYHQIKGKVK